MKIIVPYICSWFHVASVTSKWWVAFPAQFRRGWRASAGLREVQGLEFKFHTRLVLDLSTELLSSLQLYVRHRSVTYCPWVPGIYGLCDKQRILGS